MDEAAFLQAAAELGLPLQPAEIERFQRYLALLQQWGEKLNLTAIRDASQVRARHFFDSLVLVRHLPDAPSLSLVDVGTGAGFPGVVCAILRPGWRITLVERVQKKAAFLLALRRELGLDYRVSAKDIKDLRETFQVAVSRAAFPPAEWRRVGAGLVAPGGWLAAMIGGKEEPLPAPPGFVQAQLVDYRVDVIPHRLLLWQRLP